MEKITFTYSKIAVWYNVFWIFFAGLIFSRPIFQKDGALFWPCIIVDMLLLITLGIYSYKILIPALKGKVIMELNEDHMYFFPSKKLVYWRNVSDITLLRGFGAFIRFEMKGRLDNVTVGMRFIRGQDKSILETVQNYFRQTVHAS